MFHEFANVWTPATLASRLKPNSPLPLQLAGEKLVFFRDSKGVPGALLDRCPHRGVALSLGKVKGDCLECPFHAWQFNTEGRVCEIPLNPDAKRERLFATSVPVREIGGLLWVYTAATRTPPNEPVVPDGLTMPGLARTYLEVEWKAHWSRAMENMLDSPHVPYLHAKTIGRFVRPMLKPGSKMEIVWEDTPFGGRTQAIIDGKEGGGRLDFYRPNIMVLHIPMPNQTFRMHAIAVPVSERAVRMIVIGARSFARFPLLNPLFNWSNRKIVNEDRAVVESSDPVEVPPANHELSVATDRATLRFRRYYFEELKRVKQAA